MLLTLDRLPLRGIGATVTPAEDRTASLFAQGVRTAFVLVNGALVTLNLLAVYWLPIAELRPEWLIYFSDPRCNTLPGLLAVLRETNPDVDPDTYVSLIFFEVAS